MPLILEAGDAAQHRAVAGLPSVDPRVRARREYVERQRIKTRSMTAEAEQKQAALTAPDGKRPTTEYDAQRGIELSPNEFIRRILQLNRNLYFEPAKANRKLMGVYLLDASVDEGKRFICGMDRERMLPEFSVRQVTDGQFTEIRGWRTVLARLIRARLVSKDKADILFGPPNRDSRNWQILTS